MQCRTVGCRAKFFGFDLVLSSALVLFFQLPVHADQSVTLSWDPSSSSNVAGYNIYSRHDEPRAYTSVVAVGDITHATISGLVPGTTYYFAATTYDDAGNESDFSNEISNTVPVTAAPALALAALSGGQFSFTVSGEAGQQYVVQTSTNLARLDFDPDQCRAGSVHGQDRRQHQPTILPGILSAALKKRGVKLWRPAHGSWPQVTRHFVAGW